MFAEKLPKGLWSLQRLPVLREDEHTTPQTRQTNAALQHLTLDIEHHGTLKLKHLKISLNQIQIENNNECETFENLNQPISLDRSQIQNT